MLALREYQHAPSRLSDLINWAGLVSSSTILNKDGSLQSSIRYRGPDLESSTEAELISVCARLNNVLKRLGSGWAIFAEATRTLSQDYPESSWPDPISYLIDDERRLLFKDSQHFESNYYISLVYLPPSDSQTRLSAKFLEKDTKRPFDYGKLLESFESEVSRIAQLLETLFPEVELLVGQSLLTYLHSTVSQRRHPIQIPEVPLYLDSLLCDSPLLPGFEPKLGSKYLRLISMQAFPGKSQPGILDALNRLPLEYRWVTRFLCLDRVDAETEINRFKKRWFAKRKGIVTLLKEVLTGSESVMSDSDAINKAADADSALQELLSEAVSFGYFTGTICVSDEKQEIAEAHAAEVLRVINGLGFTARIEDVNSVDAWLGTIPGNVYNNVRRPILHTLNLSHLLPISAIWAGPESNQHLKGPPLLFALTNGSTPFRLLTHVGDVGHALIIGPTGAGKSVLLNIMEAQFLRYPDAQVYIFDKGGSSRVLTAGVGGDFYDLGSKQQFLSFQPLAHIDKESERSWAHEWIIGILNQENVKVDPHIKDQLWQALSSLSTAQPQERTLFGLTILLQNELLRRALLPFTVQGAHGSLLDNTSDNLDYGHWQAFEMETLMETPSVVMPVLSYLFHRLEQRFSGRPTLLILDEAWLFLDNELFAAKIREWLKVLRKSNVSVIFATQSLADIAESSIVLTLKEACFTKIYLPNPTAFSEDSQQIYRRFGLNERQIEIISLATPKREYYYTSPLGNRIFELGLGEVALTYCASTSKEAQLQLQHLNASGASCDELNLKLLQRSGVAWAANYLEKRINQRRTA